MKTLLVIALAIVVVYLVWVIGQALSKHHFFKDNNDNKVPDGVDEIIVDAKEVVEDIKDKVKEVKSKVKGTKKKKK